MSPAPPAPTTTTPAPQSRRAVVGSTIGTTIENYDFLAYGTAAALYLGPRFFPSDDRLFSTLAAFATLGVGFVMRPIGGVLAGHVGDRFGRKPVLVGALILMGVATVGVGLLPTYETVGVWAPVLLVTLRLLQGIGYGAEWGGAVLMAYEHAPRHRKGAFSSVPQIGVPAGLLLANLAFLAVAGVGDDVAWRVPFLLSSVLIVVGLVLRASLHESPEFAQAQAEGRLVQQRSPVLAVLREDWRTVLRAVALRLAETCGFYVTVTFLISYLTSAGITDRSTVLTGVVVASALGLVSHPLVGALSDRVGRRPVYLAGAAFTAAFAVPLFLLVNTGVAVLVVLGMTLFLVLGHDVLAAVQPAWFAELFATGKRTSGASLGYQGAAVVAGFVPFAATALTAAVGWVGVALLMVVIGLVSLAAARSTPETAPLVVGRAAQPERAGR